MNVFCQIKLKNEVYRTTTQSGQQPKWNENFDFSLKDDKENHKIEFAVFHKPFLLSEEKVGETVFKIY